MPSYTASRLLFVSLLFAVAIARTVIIGDSMFAGGSKVNQWLQEWAGHSIENVAIVGSSLHDGWTASVPSQFFNLDKTEMPTTIIMDGGGNDVISVRGDCEAFNAHCIQVIDEAVDIASNLFKTMNDTGVAHVIYMGFFYIGNLRQAVDYGTKTIKAACDAAPLDCHFADPRNQTIITGWDGVHPNDDGYKLLAETIWQTKTDYDIPV